MNNPKKLLLRLSRGLYRAGRLLMLKKEKERTSCPFCWSDAAAPYRHRADIVRCAHCDTVYLRTRLTAASMERLYDFYADGNSHMRLPSTDQEATQSGLRREAYLDEIMALLPSPAGGRHLDVGCGWGAFLAASRDRGLSAQGIELTPKCVAFATARRGIPVVRGQFLDQPVEPASFHLLTMIHVLEHLPKPRETLKRAFDLLEPGGFFCGIVPNINSYLSQTLRGKWEWLDPYYHYVHYTPETLSSHLKNAGFDVARLYTCAGDFTPGRVLEVLRKNNPGLDESGLQQRLQELEAQGQGEEIRHGHAASFPATCVPTCRALIFSMHHSAGFRQCHWLHG